MVQLNYQTEQQLVEQGAAAIAANTSLVNDFTVGSFARALLESVASVGLFFQSLLFQTLQVTRLTTSSGSDVDSFVADFTTASDAAIIRLPAVSATGNVTFTRYTATTTVTLLPGVQIVTADGTQSFVVAIDTTNSYWNAAQAGYVIPAGTSTFTVQVTAANAGSQGNVAANTISLIQSASPFDLVTNPSAFVNGVNAESDASFKARFAQFINTRSLSTVQAVQYAATSVQPGMTAFVSENVNTAGWYDPGYFVVTIDDGSGYPPSSLIASAYSAVSLVRGATIAFTVQPPTVVLASLSMTISVATGYTKATIQPMVVAAITNYIASLPVGVAFPYSMIASLAYGVSPGITNVTNILANGGTADLGGGPTQAVVTSSITVN